MNTLKKATCLLLATATFAFSSGKDWMSDFDAAKAKAAKEDKALLVEFTGSDWCPPCISLNKEVFSKDTFLDEARKNFVLVSLDFPKRKELSADLKKQNTMLAKKYGVQGFPTILFMNAKGKVFKQAGYQPGGVKTYLALLDSALEMKDLD